MNTHQQPSAMGLPSEAPIPAGIPGTPPAPPPEGTPPVPAPPVPPVDGGTPVEPAPETPGTPEPSAPETTPDTSKAQDGIQPPKQPEPEPDRSAQNNEHYQTQYQGVMEFLNTEAPQIAEKYRQMRTGQGPQAPQGEPPMSAPPVAPVEPQQPAQPSANADLDWSDPNQVIDVFETRMRNIMTEKQTEQRNEDLENTWVNESQAVGKQYAQFSAGIPKDVMAKAEQAAEEKLRFYTGQGIEETTKYPGGPMKALRVIVEAVNELRRTDNFQMQSAEAQGQMATELKNNMMMQQPSPTAPPDPNSALTPEQKQLEKMKGVGNNPFSVLIDE